MLFFKLKWFFVKEWKHYTGAIILLIIIALLQLLPPYLVGLIIDEVLLNKISNYFLLYLIILMIIVALLIYILRFIWRILLFGAAYRLAVELRNRIYNVLSKQSPEFYFKNRIGDLMTRATNDVDCVVFAAGEGVLTLVDSLVMGCLVLILMSYKISWQLTLISLIPMPIMALIIKKYGQDLHEKFCIAQSSFSNLNNQTQENLTNIRMIKSFGLESYQSKLFSDIACDVSKKNMLVSKIDAKFDPTIYLSVGLSNILAICTGSWFIINHIITIGQFTSFIMYLGLMIWPMLALAWMFNIVERGNVAYERICQTLNADLKIKDGNLPLPSGSGILQVYIKEFSYPKSSKIALYNISFDLYPGNILGLCGPVGSGKSTLISIILRNFDIINGNIKFCNLPLKSLIINQWRNKLSVVNQNTFLFSDSILNNISFGNSKASLYEIKTAAKLANLHEDIMNLPQRYNTIIGERGIILSGGQKQRLAIARALLTNSDILILDDALSAVDGYTEHIILNNIYKWKKERTLIIITNRVYALKKANEILVLDNGYIIQRGDHISLLKKSGWYSDIYYYQQMEPKYR